VGLWQVWSAVSGRICRWYDGHSGIIHSLSWKPFPDDDEGDILLTGCQDGTLKMWDITGEPTGKGSNLLEVDLHRGRMIPRPGYMNSLFEGSVFAAGFSADGGLFATGCYDGRVRVYDPDDWSAVHDWGGHGGTVRGMSWAADGTVLATCSDDGTTR
jgi:WD40 repeat protein